MELSKEPTTPQTPDDVLRAALETYQGILAVMVHKAPQPATMPYDEALERLNECLLQWKYEQSCAGNTSAYLGNVVEFCLLINGYIAEERKGRPLRLALIRTVRIFIAYLQAHLSQTIAPTFTVARVGIDPERN